MTKSLHTDGKVNPHKVTKSKSKAKVIRRKQIKKNKWTSQEDLILKELMKDANLNCVSWTYLAKSLPNRTGKQCRERWFNHLRPDLKKGAWSKKEDETILLFQHRIGNNWCFIAKALPNRTDNDVKNRYHALNRKRKPRSVYMTNVGVEVITSCVKHPVVDPAPCGDPSKHTIRTNASPKKNSVVKGEKDQKCADTSMTLVSQKRKDASPQKNYVVNDEKAQESAGTSLIPVSTPFSKKRAQKHADTSLAPLSKKRRDASPKKNSVAKDEKAQQCANTSMVPVSTPTSKKRTDASPRKNSVVKDEKAQEFAAISIALASKKLAFTLSPNFPSFQWFSAPTNQAIDIDTDFALLELAEITRREDYAMTPDPSILSCLPDVPIYDQGPASLSFCNSIPNFETETAERTVKCVLEKKSPQRQLYSPTVVLP